MKNTSQILVLGALLSLPAVSHAVTLEDCRAEQQEFMSQCTADRQSAESCKQELEQQIGLANVSIDLEDARKAINGSKRLREGDEEVLASFDQTPPFLLDTRFPPSSYRRSIARHSLHICFTSRRYAEMSSGAEPPEEKRCNPEAARAVNQELADIEGRITNFLLSPAATMAAGATPTLRVGARRKLSDSVIGTGIPHLGRGHHGNFLVEMRHVMAEVAGVRRMGAAALDLAYVAAGRLDGFWESGLSPWDMAAGLLLIREAGGFASDREGGQEMLDTGNVVAGNETIHRVLLRQLRKPLTPRPA